MKIGSKALTSFKVFSCCLPWFPFFDDYFILERKGSWERRKKEDG